MEILEREIYKRYIERLSVEGFDSLNFQDIKPRRVCFKELLDAYDVFCFDGYGTLYNKGNFVYPGARRWFDALRKSNKQVRLVTNAASDVNRVLAAAAAKRGFNFTAEETVSSGGLLMDLVHKLRETPAAIHLDGAAPSLMLREAYYIGRETGKNVLDACGIRAVAADAYPEEPVVAISSAKETPETYARSVEILKRPGAILLVLNSDAWAPKIDGTREPVSGALSERLRRDSACDANAGLGPTTYYLGKPFPAIWKKVRSSIPFFVEGQTRVLMIGDTLGTDILGARVAGFHSALIIGRNQPADELVEDEKKLGIVPNYYLVID